MRSSLSASGGARRGRGAQMFVEEAEDFAPAIERLLGAIGGTRGVEEGVAGAVVAVELVSFAELLEDGFGAVHLVAVRVFILVAEKPEQRTAQLGRQIDRRNRPLS